MKVQAQDQGIFHCIRAEINSAENDQSLLPENPQLKVPILDINLSGLKRSDFKSTLFIPQICMNFINDIRVNIQLS